MSELHKMIEEARVKYRQCPGCNYLVSQLEWELAIFDLPCNGCRKHTLNEFILEKGE